MKAARASSLAAARLSAHASSTFGRIRSSPPHGARPVRCFGSRGPRSSAGEAPPFAFALDSSIDGVLLHVSRPIPGASEALQYLHTHHIPFILLTNGGGKHEAERVADLRAKLGVPLTEANLVQSHTPLRQLVAPATGPDSLADRTVLVTGADAARCRAIAEAYGFRRVVIPADILAALPSVWPFDPLMRDLYGRQARPLPQASRPLKIDAIFVFNDPRDWALDTQLIVDLLLSEEGYLGSYSRRNGDKNLPGCGWQGHAQPPVYFSNEDLFWSTGYHLPRFGQGAFQAAVAGVWRRVTGGHELQRKVLGKPHAETYRFAEQVLTAHRHEMLARAAADSSPREDGEDGKTDVHVSSPPLRSVYMVGDNPESDIAGANDFVSEAGTKWTSILVRTGVWSTDRAGETALEGRFKPKVIVDHVKAAVRWALQKEGWKGSL